MTAQVEYRDTSHDKSEYGRLYEELGRKYPETKYAHTERFVGSRYWTIMRELEQYSKESKRLIDLGCNDGVYSIPYALRGGESVGVDISESLVHKASQLAGSLKARCTFLQGEIDSPRLTKIVGTGFDVALFSEVLEHLQYPDQALRNVNSLLLPGSDLILSTPTPLFNGTRLSTRYVIDIFRGKKISENFELNTLILKRFDVSAFTYRHDGYYPIALKKYVESFGFMCLKSFTIDYLRAPEKSLENISSEDGANFLERERSMKEQAVSYLRQIGLALEIPLRIVPILNRFGSTNVVIFRKL